MHRVPRPPEALLQDVTTALRNDWPVDRASLVEAARYFQARGGKR